MPFTTPTASPQRAVGSAAAGRHASPLGSHATTVPTAPPLPSELPTAYSVPLTTPTANSYRGAGRGARNDQLLSELASAASCRRGTVGLRGAGLTAS